MVQLHRRSKGAGEGPCCGKHIAFRGFGGDCVELITRVFRTGLWDRFLCCEKGGSLEAVDCVRRGLCWRQQPHILNTA